MADIQHSAITDPQIHEPKGASSAGTNTVYVADGAGSGSWQVVPVDALDYTALLSDLQSDVDDGDLALNASYFMHVIIEDISTASSVLIPIINDSTVIGASLVLGGAITTADAEVSFKDSTGASLGTPVTVPFSGSAKGDQFSFTATSNEDITGPDWIEIETDGGSDTAQPLFVTLELTTQLN